MEEPMLMGLDPADEPSGNDIDRSDPTATDPTMADPTMADALGKPRRVQPKLTSDILLSERGLPHLVKHGPRRLRISTSRNKPYDNLAQIVRFYQLWAHELYPRAKFKDFIKLCQNMRNDKAVREYRMELCLREMNPSRYDEPVRGNGDGDGDDDDIYQDTASKNEPERDNGSNPDAETGAQQGGEEEILDTQEPAQETRNEDPQEDDPQEDEDAMEVMKELGF